MQVSKEIISGTLLSNQFDRMKVEVFFQEMISMSDQTLMGLEGFCRVNSKRGSENAASLFARSDSDAQTIDLDRIFRFNVFEKFLPIAESGTDLALFLNFETSLVDKGVVGSGHILETAKKTGVDPDRVVIEIVETEAMDVDALLKFTSMQREYGFLIALSNAGSKLSSLDRIFMLKPDVVKIHMDVIRDIDKSSSKHEIFRGLVNMSHRVGALVAALGVEREEEAMVCLDLGADILQGFYFGYPFPESSDAPEKISEKAISIGEKFKELRRTRMTLERARLHKYSRIADRVLPVIGSYGRIDFDEAINKIIKKQMGAECVYVLDNSGIQVTDTIFNKRGNSGKKKLLYRPAKKRTDLSIKEYFMAIKNGQPHYVTKPYISLATGAHCITLSAPFKDRMGMDYVLCIDFNAESALDFEKAYMNNS